MLTTKPKANKNSKNNGKDLQYVQKVKGHIISMHQIVKKSHLTVCFKERNKLGFWEMHLLILLMILKSSVAQLVNEKPL